MSSSNEILANELSKVLFGVPLAVIEEEEDDTRFKLLCEIFTANRLSDLSPEAYKLYTEKVSLDSRISSMRKYK